MPQFTRYIGIDYSGAETPEASLKGLRVYMADGTSQAKEVPPPPSPRWYWARREVSEWLVEILPGKERAIVGIDHGFSFPLKYFKRHHLEPNWSFFLDDFQKYWPSDEKYTYVESIREGRRGDGNSRLGSTRWKRLCEERTRSAKSVFHFDVPGSVAKSTHAGLPWLRFIRKRLGDKVHFWPFDGWKIPEGRSVIAEVYPSLWRHDFPRIENVTDDQHDAFCIASWLRDADIEGKLSDYFEPGLNPENRKVAEIEGWILGVK